MSSLSSRPAVVGSAPLRRTARSALAPTLGLVLALLGLTGGMGWLYALYRGHLLGLGPRVHDGLPLEALAGHSAQPLLRFAVAWLAAGVGAGVIVRATRSSLRTGLSVFALASAVLVVAGGALSDALTANQPLADHLLSQLASTANLLAWACLVVGAELASGGARRRRS